jgi:hypothetical protein
MDFLPRTMEKNLKDIMNWEEKGIGAAMGNSTPNKH